MQVLSPAPWIAVGAFLHDTRRLLAFFNVSVDADAVVGGGCERLLSDLHLGALEFILLL